MPSAILIQIMKSSVTILARYFHFFHATAFAIQRELHSFVWAVFSIHPSYYFHTFIAATPIVNATAA